MDTNDETNVPAAQTGEWAPPDGADSDEWDDTSERRMRMPPRHIRRPVRCSGHALCRAARRNIVPDAIDYVLAYGRRMQVTGVTFCFLGRRDVPRADRAASWVARLVGTVVMLGRDGVVITVYRNQHAWKGIRHKLKYNIPTLSPRQSREDRDNWWIAPILQIA